MNTPKAPFTPDAERRSAVKIYDRPGALALAARPISLIALALISLAIASFVYYKYYAV
jgi:hypothetical protein